jgi:site-specific DNA-methyltransferase (adenine-specific)
MEPWHDDDRATIYSGDCLEVLRALPDASVDAVVTDPPYGLEFMGKDWDSPWKGKASREFNELEPGTLGGFTRLPNHSRVNNVKCQTCERWKFSSNPCRCPEPDFPNARLGAMAAFQAWCEAWAAECLRVLKPGGHLLAFGGTRTWHRLACAIEDAGFEVRDSIAWMYGSGFPKSLDVSKAIDKAAGAERQVVGPNRFAGINGKANADVYGVASRPDETAPVTDAARKWSGWGTALKPAHEPIVVARKPLVGTVAANVLEHGTGALNIDACRIGTEAVKVNTYGGRGPFGDSQVGLAYDSKQVAGRWPANVALDEDQAAELDRQSGTSKGTARVGFPGGKTFGGSEMKAEVGVWYGDSGGASRFFYVAKAPARERPKVDGTAHPTVKPLTLMRWLCRLVTPPDGVILEPFAGSGTTVEAALLEGFRVVAIEREADYLPLIQARLDRVAATEPEDEQLTLDASA